MSDSEEEIEVFHENTKGDDAKPGENARPSDQKNFNNCSLHALGYI